VQLERGAGDRHRRRLAGEWHCGLAGRVPDPADRRRNVISITPAGTAHLRRLEELLADVQDELLTGLSPAERQQLIRLLNRILEHHDGT